MKDIVDSVLKKVKASPILLFGSTLHSYPRKYIKLAWSNNYIEMVRLQGSRAW